MNDEMKNKEPHNKSKIVLYMHAGSGNHGCEAIADSFIRMLAEKECIEAGRAEEADTQKDSYVCESDVITAPIIVSHSVLEDRKYSLGALEQEGLCRLLEENEISSHFFIHTAYYLYRKLTHDNESFQRYRFGELFKLDELKSGNSSFEHTPIAVSIGGDNYCYPEMVGDLILAHNVFIQKGFKTVLMGCSIEPDSLKDEKLLKDLAAYEKIIARESITFNALISCGLDKTKLSLCSDPAFALPATKCELPEGFAIGNTVGINLSPMAAAKEQKDGITLENYRKLISNIIDNTDMQIALIPHVVWGSNDDRMVLSKLYNEYQGTGRVIMIPDMDAEKLKFVISKCSFMVGARTHSTIAAYSSCVPTLVLGYSVKSRGIAKDLFCPENEDVSRYVIPVQSLDAPDDLTKAFEWIIGNEESIRNRLIKVMPEYISRAKGNTDF